MKKLSVLLISLFIIILTSCSEDTPTSSTPKTSFWKQTGMEIWWIYEINGTAQSGTWSSLEKIGAIPYGNSFTVSRTPYGTHLYSIIGADYNFTLTDSNYVMVHKYSTDFSWDPLPVNMTADTLYTMGAEVKGDQGMISGSDAYKYSGSNSWILTVNRNAGKTYAKVKISKPTDLTNPDKMVIKYHVTSAYAFIDYMYIYEWVTE